MTPAVPLLLALVLASAPAAAQHRHGAHGHHPAAPYAGLETRSIKSLSAAEVADLRAGRGMGLALAAELNGYPGPMHVLEHAAALGLNDGQSARMRELEAGMRAQAIALGERLVTEEEALDRLFARGRIDRFALAEATARIGATTAALREVHLRTHLDVATALTDEQIARYGRLRGYGAEYRRPGVAPMRQSGAPRR
jgi:Spy/CpxP family protein refolding chaperone